MLLYVSSTKYLPTVFYEDKICIFHGNSRMLPMTTIIYFTLKIDILFHLTKSGFY